MQAIERPMEAPEILLGPAAGQSRRRMREFWALDRTRRAQTSVPSSDWLTSEDEALIAALSEMSGGRCAFCEAEASDLRVHRFRPIGNALPIVSSSNAHLYYLWLADAWDNLYPICTGCTPPEPQFPIDGTRASLPTLRQIDNYLERETGRWPSFPPKEAMLLLDPVNDRQFEKHLLPKLSGELVGASRRGDTTIDVFDLNRSDRRNERYQAYRRSSETLLQLLPGASTGKSAEEWDRLFDFESLQFGGTWYLMLRRIARSVGGSSEVRSRTSKTFIKANFANLAKSGDAVERVETALDAMADEDQSLRPGRWAAGSVYSLRVPPRSVLIQNFKAIETLQLDFDLPTLTPDGPVKQRAPSLVILGENATGKSSILEAVALALSSDNARRALNLTWSQFVLDPTQLGAEHDRSRRASRVLITLQTGQTATLTIDQGVHRVTTNFGNHLVPVFAYGAFRRFLKGTRKSAPHQHIWNLFDGSTLSNPEPWLRQLPAEQFNAVIRTLRDLLSVEGEFDVIKRQGNSRQLRMISPIDQPDGSRLFKSTPLRAVSSGYRSMLAMLCDIMRGLMNPQVYENFETFETAQGIVLIDEIEAHLHPRWKVQVMSSLRQALPGMTFIVTTHDPLCLRGMGDREVVVLQHVATADSARESQFPVQVEKMTNLPAMSDLRIEQLLTSDFFQLLSSDDAAADRRLAHIGDLIAARKSGTLSREDEGVLTRFEADIATALPVGSSEVHRIVQEAVAEYLRQRRAASAETLARLRTGAKAEILAALRRL